MATGTEHTHAVATDLPDVTGVRTRVVEGGRETVVVEFESGASVRYRRDEDAVREAWVGPEADPTAPAHVNRREADAGPEALALRTLAEYLSFEDARHAEFVWGERNLAAVLGE